MRIVIIGAAGRTGRHVLQQALAAGHTVTAFIQEHENIGLQEARLSIIRGDARSQADLSNALMGQEAILCTLGSAKAREQDLMTRSMESLVAAARATGVKRIVLLSSFMVTPNYRPTGLLRLLGFVFGRMVEDKRASENILRQSGLDWTIVYATRLDHAPANSTLRVVGPNERVTLKNGIARADVARFLLVHTADRSTIHQQLIITTT